MNNNHDVLNCKKCLYLRMLAIIFWSCGLVVLSLMPGAGRVYLFDDQDKVFHFIAYLLNAWLTCRALQLFNIKAFKIVIISVIYSVLLGGVLELSQGAFTQYRQAEWLDFLANASGAVIGCVLFCLQERVSSRYNGNEF